ncbi:hypothetical protein B0T17DRAFT_507063 [Bombardia bombarda]|uniref:FluG domain-containing protein n=1 Tax=Bombardia bombarda TaxID=252184 RepID=A0AA39XAZ4_9PEZI|nr:hypothetical protein B0T17DRAFT_507063 [Bombardia bombarda]
MRHDPKFYTFQSAYLNEIAKFHLQNAFLEEETEDQLFRLFAHVSLTRDPRATRDMVPAEVWANRPPDPEISALEEQKAELKQGRYRFQGREDEAKIQALTKEIRNKRAQRNKRTVKDYREYYFYNNPTWALETLCGKRETVKRNRTPPTAYTEPPATLGFTKPEVELEPASDHFPLLMNTNQCPECIGDERLTLGERAFRYSRPTKRNDHFDDHHLEAKERAEQLGQLIKCTHEKCKDVKLSTVDHFRNHVKSVHKIVLRPSHQAQERRARKLMHRRSRNSG